MHESRDDNSLKYKELKKKHKKLVKGGRGRLT